MVGNHKKFKFLGLQIIPLAASRSLAARYLQSLKARGMDMVKVEVEDVIV